MITLDDIDRNVKPIIWGDSHSQRIAELEAQVVDLSVKLGKALHALDEDMTHTQALEKALGECMAERDEARKAACELASLSNNWDLLSQSTKDLLIALSKEVLEQQPIPTTETVPVFGPKPVKLSPRMQAAFNHMQQNGGKLKRFPGGYWAREGWSWSNRGPSFGTSTIEALVSRDVAYYSDWKDGRGGQFPVEVKICDKASAQP